ncbi:ABC transporter ATP-binding protein [Sulfurimonas autotrophica]|uniref:ABC transporter related protein n=1 Tax=Sulfurimonas autotrophica (strain ATCC BAA-671 / DSM 16294 / JCM 11897 / OK10) TaxID=563040 RepID=E0UTY8_SULAO|nr:ABC transporter ATP-binding protein [Sulfurimonas autotrophica]ADN09432.1 ABC transporter related protein [Sulfurimonas autotrophica DSM 16294]
MNKTILHCKDIIKTFGSGESEVFALRGVTLDVYEGELLMLVGPSGCGKTTFVSVITALLSFDSGICNVLGHDLTTMDEDEKVLFRGKSVGFVFQAFNLLPSLTAVENVALPLTIAGEKRAIALQKAKAMLDEVELSSKYDVRPSHLSGGQQQRVAIARALVHNPEFIICDEPTSSLDHKSGQIVMELLSKMTKEKGKTMIVVTHDNRIYEYGDRMAHMEDGKIIKIEEN